MIGRTGDGGPPGGRAADSPAGVGWTPNSRAQPGVDFKQQKIKQKLQKDEHDDPHDEISHN